MSRVFPLTEKLELCAGRIRRLALAEIKANGSAGREWLEREMETNFREIFELQDVSPEMMEEA